MIRGQSSDDEDIPIPDWIFTKHMPHIIGRMRTEVGGGTFAAKIFKTSTRQTRDDVASAPAIDVTELLAPKKKKRAASKGKVKAKATPRKSGADDDAKEDPDSILADIEEGSGCSRKRWRIDDVLSALIHAAGLFDCII